MERFDMVMKDEKPVSVSLWVPEGQKKGIVQISHGMAEHIMRYEHIARYLCDHGYVVIGDDHRAHGLTDKNTLGYSDGDIATLTLSDMAEITAWVKKKYPKLKVVLFGHSYGSFLTQWYIQEHGDLIDGAVLGGSAKMTGLVPFLGRKMANIGYRHKGAKAPAALMKKVTFDAYEKQLKDGSFISSIKEETDKYLADPMCAFTCSYGFYKYFFKMFTVIYKKKNLEKIDKNKPLLIMSGDHDPVGSYTKTTKKLYRTYQKLGVKDVSLKFYAGVRHEYFNDTSRKEAFDDVLHFADKICE